MNEMKKKPSIDISYVYDQMLQPTSTRIKRMNFKNTFREKSIENKQLQTALLPYYQSMNVESKVLLSERHFLLKSKENQFGMVTS